MFETNYVDELMAKIEKNHGDTFYNVFLKAVSVLEESGAAEYEIYFNYMLANHADAIIVRKLNWVNTPVLNTTLPFDYISYPWYMR
jgi:hypothetical protein